MTEGRGRRTEDGRQMADGRRQRTGDREQILELGSRNAEVGISNHSAKGIEHREKKPLLLIRCLQLATRNPLPATHNTQFTTHNSYLRSL
jgi:hypothetical protein